MTRDTIEQPDISIVIVSWNVRHLLLKCLESIWTYAGSIALEVIVVDNDSHDGTPAAVEAIFPHVTVIRNRENAGFSRANNQGIRIARGRLILLLNPDTLWIDESLAKLAAWIDEHPRIGVVAPKLLNGDASTAQFPEGARRLPTPFDTFCQYTGLSGVLSGALAVKLHLSGERDHRHSREVNCLSGACLLARREVFAEVGDLDEGYPFNAEDIDWCHRISGSRWKLYYLSEARLVHFGRQSILQNRGMAALMAMRGILRYYGKFYGRTTAFTVWAMLWPVSVLKLAAWAGIYVIRPSRRASAGPHVAALSKICALSPWRADASQPASPDLAGTAPPVPEEGRGTS